MGLQRRMHRGLPLLPYQMTGCTGILTKKRPMFMAEVDGIPCGYYSLLDQGNGECELNNLAVLPEYRHRGLGRQLLEHSFATAQKMGCQYMNIGIVEENTVLRKWYEQNGAYHTGTKKYDFFPFTCGYLRKKYEYIIIVMNHGERWLRKSDGYEIQYC